MTNHWADLENADCVLIMGSNAAENHPISFKWVMKARKKGAKAIHVDPRYTRTSARCDKHAHIRSGSDIAFLGGLIKYILDNKLYFEEYVRNYTNASFLVNEEFAFEEGVFSGYNADKRAYDKSTWSFQLDEKKVPMRDNSFKDPNCVLNIMRKHYARYNLDRVSDMTGVSKKDLESIYALYAATGKPDKAGTIMYAMGWTQHTYGVQNIRTMAIVQLLLGNIGIAGGGVNALRGESNVQGSTDQALLSHIYPGYLPVANTTHVDFDTYCKKTTPVSHDSMSTNWWQHRPKYAASFIKSMYPNQEVKDAFQYFPRVDAGVKMTDYFWMSIISQINKGNIKGLFAWGMNPTCGGPDANTARDGFAKLDWLVNVNLYENETSSFWKGPGQNPKDIGTEVFFLPCAAFNEKEGSVVNSGRWMQWRYAGPKPLEGTQPDGEMIYWLAEELQKLYAEEGGAYPEPVLNLGIDMWAENHLFSATKVAKLMNGYFVKDVQIGDKLYKAGTQVPNFLVLQNDGSTASGNWLHGGSWPEAGNMMARRDSSQTDMQANVNLYPNWSFAWPVNRRIVYNRASVDAKGQPYNKNKAVVQWQDGKWVGDVIDGGGGPGARHPFIMRTSGMGTLFGQGLADGPLPEYYEPMESPLTEHAFSKQFNSPVAFIMENAKLSTNRKEFPFIGTTYRVTEHWQTGLMTRRMSWLVECEPQLFAEISPELAKLRGIANGDKVKLTSIRGELIAVAIVTERLKPFVIDGKPVHMVGFPWHFGWLNPKDGGDSANLLTPAVGDPNVGIPESKAFMVNIEKVD